MKFRNKNFNRLYIDFVGVTFGFKMEVTKITALFGGMDAVVTFGTTERPTMYHIEQLYKNTSNE